MKNKEVLVISGHPNLKISDSNAIILRDLEESDLNISIRKLDELYGDNYNIKVQEEQAALLKADVVVFQFPFYRYSFPALLKKWLDEVFLFNFAYGSKGDKLKGKDAILSITIGALEDDYQPLGAHHFSVEELLKPIQQTVYLSQMIYHHPVMTYDVENIVDVYGGANTAHAGTDKMRDKSHKHAKTLIKEIKEIINI